MSTANTIFPGVCFTWSAFAVRVAGIKPQAVRAEGQALMMAVTAPATSVAPGIHGWSKTGIRSRGGAVMFGVSVQRPPGTRPTILEPGAPLYELHH